MTADRVLVTGAGGFLARALVARLERRVPVFKAGRAAAPGVRAFDLRDPERARALVAAARPRRVYHLAGDARARDWDGLWRSHVAATVNLLEALTARGEPVRVVVAGSSAEYGTAGGVRPREDGPAEPVSLYGACKLAQTLAALSFSRGPVAVVVARLFNVLGPGTPPHLAPGAFARQLARIRDGLQPPELAVGNLDARRDYLDARDAAAALEVLMRRGTSAAVYNAGSGRSVRMRALLDAMSAAAGVRARLVFDPARSRPSEVRDLRADARRLRALGWRPRVPLARSLAETLPPRGRA